MLLSIIIPTRNRQQYCFLSILAILKTVSESCEIVIHDNSDTKELEVLLADITDTRLKYYYSSEPLSFVANFSRSLEMSNGDYFCFLGDDDGVLPYITEVAEWMMANDVESLCSIHIPDYTWINPVLEKKSGDLILHNYTLEISQINVRSQLKQLIRNGLLLYQKYNLPRTYHGIVRRSCMERVKAITGHYFGGLTPDIYSTVALSCIITKHVLIDFPITVAGACPKSASVANMTGKHSGALEDAPHFHNRGKYIWENMIPQYYSVETIWADSAIKALKEMNENKLLSEFDQNLFIISSILANRYYITKLAIKKSFILSISLRANVAHSLRLLFKSFTVLPMRIYNSITKKNRRSISFEDTITLIKNVMSLDSAVEIVSQKTGERFNVFLKKLNRYVVYKKSN